MDSLTLEQLCEATDGQLVGEPDGPICRIAIDSRRVQRGDLYWALLGKRFNGEEFVDAAMRRGAAGCVVRWRRQLEGGFLIRVADTQAALMDLARWYRDQLTASVIAVTGTVGKTSTREMIHAALAPHLPGVRSRENFNNHVGLPLSLLQVEAQHAYAVLELGASHLGEIAQLAEVCKPAIGVLTGIGRAHLEGFGTVDCVAEAKKELIHALPAEGLAVVNGDDARAVKAAKRAPCPVVRVGCQSDNDLVAKNVVARPGRLSFLVDGQEIHVPATGRHFVTSALCALAVGRELRLSHAQLAEGLARYEPPPMRCEVEQIGGITVLNDAYNANPESMKAALDLLHDWPASGRRIVACGDMAELGTSSRALHRRLGTEMVRRGSADWLVACGDYASEVATGAVRAGLAPSRIVVCRNAKEAAPIVADCRRPGDILLVKGSRTMAMEQIVEHLRGASPPATDQTTRRFDEEHQPGVPHASRVRGRARTGSAQTMRSPRQRPKD